MTIRPACPQDAEALFALNEAFNGVGTTTFAQLHDSLCSNRQELVLVAEQDGAPRGFLCVQPLRSMCYGVQYAEITEVFVAEGWQRHGIGRALFSYAEAWLAARGIRSLQLFTGGENSGAQAFYRALGYLPCSDILFRKRG